MKAIKYLAMFFAAGALFAGCSDNDDELNNQNAGKPQPTVTLSKTAAVDGSFTFTIAASAEASQYGYAVFEGKGNPAPKALDIVCGDVSGSFADGVFNVAEGASQTVTIECNAAADYEVFAAAITETGLVGNEVAKMECYVPDETNPDIVDFAGAGNVVTLVFSEPVSVNSACTAKATVQYVRQMKYVTSKVEIPAENIKASGEEVTVTCPNPGDGARYMLSYPDGMFVDASGNLAPGFQSGVTSQGQIVGITWKTANVPFAIEEDSFVMWTAETNAYDPATTIDFVLPRECTASTVKNPVSVKYVTSEGEKTLYAEFELGEDGKTVKVTRPEIPLIASFDVVVAAGAFVDAWGNPNAAFTPSKLRYSTSPVEIKEGDYKISFQTIEDQTGGYIETVMGADATPFPCKLTKYNEEYYALQADWFNFFGSFANPVLLGKVDYTSSKIVFDGAFLHPNGSIVTQSCFNYNLFYVLNDGAFYLCFCSAGENGDWPLEITFDEEGYMTEISYFDYTILNNDETYSYYGLLGVCTNGEMTFVPAEEAGAPVKGAHKLAKDIQLCNKAVEGLIHPTFNYAKK